MTKKIEKFIMVTPRAVSPSGTNPRIHPPLGAISVLAEIKRNGIEVALLDAAAEGLKRNILDISYNPIDVETLDDMSYWKTGLRNEEVIEKIADFRPDAIGISCCTVVDRGETASIAKAIKKAFPTIPLILGGHEATQWYQEILGNTVFPIETIPEIDYIVVGAGQPVLPPLLRFIANPSLCILPPGVAYRSDNQIKFTGTFEFDPNQFAIPDYSLLPRIQVDGRDKPLDIYSYVGNPHAGKIGTILGIKDHPISYLPLLTSYGCGFNCSFCDTDKRLIRYSVENVLKIIEEFDRLFGIDYIDFMDNNFAGGNNESRKMAFEILSRIADMGYQIGFSNGLTFESMAREDFKLLRQFSRNENVRHIAFPCENGNDRVLSMINKPHNLSLVSKVLAFAKENLKTTNREGFFIGGFPETNKQPAENPSELENTLQFITECLKKELLHQAIFLTLSPVTREYRDKWRQLYPVAPFEHCLFSKKTKIWPYPNTLLDEMHKKVEIVNERLGRSVTRRL